MNAIMAILMNVFKPRGAHMKRTRGAFGKGSGHCKYGMESIKTRKRDR